MKMLVFLAMMLAASAAGAQKFDKPAYKVGDTWVYEVEGGSNAGRQTHAVTRVDPDGGYQISVTAQNVKWNITHNGDGHITRIGRRAMTPGRAIWRYPIEPGQSYEMPPYETPHSTREGVTVTARAQVKSITAEKVTTPAGTFDALKVEVHYPYRLEQWNNYTNHYEETYWLVPSIGRYVKLQFYDHGNTRTRREEVLVEFKRAVQ